MTPPRRNRPPTLIVIALAILFILLAILEVMAGELTPPASALPSTWLPLSTTLGPASACRRSPRAWPPTEREETMGHYLLIVAEDQPQVGDYLARQFTGVEKVKVVLDRRRGARRQRVMPYEPERRRGERRTNGKE